MSISPLALPKAETILHRYAVPNPHWTLACRENAKLRFHLAGRKDSSCAQCFLSGWWMRLQSTNASRRRAQVKRQPLPKRVFECSVGTALLSVRFGFFRIWRCSGFRIRSKVANLRRMNVNDVYTIIVYKKNSRSASRSGLKRIRESSSESQPPSRTSQSHPFDSL